MERNLVLSFAFMLSIILCGQAQQINYDSLTTDQKFERLQFQIDSLKKNAASQAEIIQRLNASVSTDSLQKKVLKSEKEMMAVRHNLYKMYKQNQAANIITYAGMAFIVIGAIVATQADQGYYFSEPAHTIGTVVGLGGGLMISFIAPVIRIDANKYLRGAGKKYKVVSIQK